MIYWGMQYDLIGEYNQVAKENCKICSELITPLYKAEQGYFKLYGMGLFPIGKKYYKTCLACKAQLKVRDSDINLPSVKNALPGENKFKYFAGWIVIFIVAVLFLWMYIEFSK